MRSFWDRQASRFDKPASPGDEAIRRTRPYLEPGMRVLEIGCAAGSTAEVLAPLVAAWHGMDISEEMIARARKRVPTATFEVGEITDVAITYDAIVAFNVLHFMPIHHLDAIRRRLKPAGLFIAQTPCLGDHRASILFKPLAFLLRIPGLQRLRMAELRLQLAERFDFVELDEEDATRHWFVGRAK